MGSLSIELFQNMKTLIEDFHFIDEFDSFHAIFRNISKNSNIYSILNITVFITKEALMPFISVCGQVPVV